MRTMYDQGDSLERVGGRFGYAAGTVGKHLFIADVIIRDTHGRESVQKAQQNPRQSRDT